VPHTTKGLFNLYDMRSIEYMGIIFNEPIYPEGNHGYLGTVCSTKASKLKPQPCEICGTLENIEKHHEDYSQPLKVRWLCAIHHLDIHKIFRQMSRKKTLELF